jgi:protein-tyrosine phosphatase
LESLLSLDMHCHLLPGIDDGAKDFEETCALARALLDYGITHVACTPHIQADLYPNTREKLLPLVAETQARLSAEGIGLTLLAGAEVRLDPDSLTPETWVTIGDLGTHVLVELAPGFPLVEQMEHQLFAMQAAGITPIIAHPERQALFLKDPEILARWVEQKGFLCQGTLCSLAGSTGQRAPNPLEAFLCRGLIHFMGTDTHHLDRRLRDLDQAVARLEALVGPENAQLIRHGNPQALLAGQPIRRPTPVAAPAPPPGLVKRFLASLRLA